MAPIMLLTGHKAEVLSLKFGNKGKYILSGSFDKSICNFFFSLINHKLFFFFKKKLNSFVGSLWWM